MKLCFIVTRGNARGCEAKQQTESIMGGRDVPLAQNHVTDVGSDHSVTLRLLHKNINQTVLFTLD